MSTSAISSSDFGRLKWAIVLLVLLSACGAAAVWTTQEMQKTSERAFRDATAARNDIRAKLARAREEQAELTDKIGRFQALKDKGYIGPEQRLDWVETLARIKAARRIARMEYDFSPQQPADSSVLPGGAGAGTYDIMASRMRLQVHLLHEGELLALIADIRNSVRALIQIQSCNLDRITNPSSERGNPDHIKAECILQWITLKERT